VNEIPLPSEQKIVIPEPKEPSADPRKNAAWKHKELQPLRFYLKMFRLSPPKLNLSQLAHKTKSKGKGEKKAKRKQAASSRKINRK
jgi:hypothetical protein